MPLPLILGGLAAIAGAAGVGAGVHGAVKMKEANDTQKEAQERHNRNLKRFERESDKTNQEMDSLGKLELSILKDFDQFSEAFEKIQNRPEFKDLVHEKFQIPQYDREELKKASVGAGVLLGGLGGAAAGTAGGFAAAGATTAAVMALGTASTGTAIASLSGAAAVNATLAALGGGALAAGGGGMALGSAVLGAATLGVGLLVGGVIFNLVGGSISDKADEAWRQMREAEMEINRICSYLKELTAAASQYKETLLKVQALYDLHLRKMQHIVVWEGRTDWNTYTAAEQMMIENTVLLVGLLYNMCKVQFVLKADNEDGVNRVNHAEIDKSVTNAKQLTGEILEREASVS